MTSSLHRFYVMTLSIVITLELTIRPCGAQDSLELATSRLQVREGYQAVLIASEPLVVDPVAARMDDQKRLWVVEMPDYPTGPRDGSPPAGRVKVLTDQDGDGRFDRATVFADGLLFPTGVQPYGTGAIVTLAGGVVQFFDDDQDGRAERRETLFQGFSEGNEQLRANHPTLGPDGLVYIAGGLRGGRIQSADRKFAVRDEPLDLAGKDFCFDPGGGAWFAVAGNSQYGITIDDFGRRIGCSNRNPAMMSIATLDAINRSHLLTPSDAIVDVAKAGDASTVRPIGQAWTTSNLHAGQFSAACGVLAPGLLASQLLDTAAGDQKSDREVDPEEWLYVCEPTGYLVQRQRLIRRNGVWQSEREPVAEEFLASTDTWFRPVDLTLGPDGALLIVDMARAVIEHPEWVPQELKNRPDTWDGDAHGRIWMVSPTSSIQQTDSSAKLSDALVIDWLNNTDPWQREQASRVVDQILSDQTANQRDELLPAIVALTFDKDIPAPVRSRAAYLAVKHAQPSTLNWDELLTDPDRRIRELAVTLLQTEPHLISDVRSVITFAGDESDAVVQQGWIQTLGESRFLDHCLDRLQDQTVAETCLSDIASVLVSAAKQNPMDLLRTTTIGTVDRRLLPQMARQLVDAWITADVDQQAKLDWTGPILQRFAYDSPVAARDLLGTYLDRADAAPEVRIHPEPVQSWLVGTVASPRAQTNWVRACVDHLAERGLLEQFGEAVLDDDLPISIRRKAADVLKVALPMIGRRVDPHGLAGLISSTRKQDLSLQVAATGLLCVIAPDVIREMVVDQFDTLPLDVRLAFVQETCSGIDGTLWLLDRCSSGDLPKSAVASALRRSLMNSGNQQIAQQANQLFQSDPNRLKVLDDYAAALASGGDVGIGRGLFRQHCAACHQIDGVGTNVGPDISDTRSRSRDYLLTAILDPNSAIDAAYTKTVVLTDDGQVVDGLLADQDAESITLTRSEGKRQRIPRDRIEEFNVTDVSLMPEGIEQSITPAEMGHLLTFLKHWRYRAAGIEIDQTTTMD